MISSSIDSHREKIHVPKGGYDYEIYFNRYNITGNTV